MKISRKNGLFAKISKIKYICNLVLRLRSKIKMQKKKNGLDSFETLYYVDLIDI